MGREINRLNARRVATLAEPGRHADGGGLYLVVDKTGAKRWVFLFRQNGRLREMGLGGLQSVPLAKARDLAGEARRTVASGGDPIGERRKVQARIPTFGEMADSFIETKKAEFRNEKHIAQWVMTLSVYAAPLRNKSVDQITTADVLGVLQPLWTTRPETASRLRGRIEQVLNAAKARGYRTGENPALWRGHLSNLLPKRQKLTRGHHKAMPFQEVPAFLAGLLRRPSVAAQALAFTILTAARSGETREAVWSEFDLDQAVWTIPAQRMKAGRTHRVPLSDGAIQILTEMRKFVGPNCEGEEGYVFPGSKRGRPLSVMAMDMVLRRRRTDVTVHGFRSSFRDWVGECTSYPREVAETALAHVVGDATERAYRRGDALEKRRELMHSWGSYVRSECSGPTT